MPDRKDNPFRPAFGTTPAVLAGREPMIRDFEVGLRSGPGDPNRFQLISGSRGSGKTVLLNEFEAVARQSGWLVVSATARSNTIDELVATTLPALLQEHDPEQRERDVLAARVWHLQVETQVEHRYVPAPTLLTRLERLLAVLAPHETGVLLTMDEVQAAAPGTLTALSDAVARLVRDERQIAFTFAGLPQGIDHLLDEPGTTFLRRARRQSLGFVSPHDTAAVIRLTVESADAFIGDDALELAVEIARGYPYLVQLIGYEAWNRAPGEALRTQDVAASRDAVIETIGSQVIHPTIRDLSTRQREYIDAMAVDDGPSSTAEIATRMGIPARDQTQYRQRLLNAEVIAPAGHGRVDFILPYTREYLRSLGAGERPLDTGISMPRSAPEE